MGNLWKIPNQKHPLKFNILKKKFNEYKQDLPLEHLKNNLNKNLLNKETTKKNPFLCLSDIQHPTILKK